MIYPDWMWLQLLEDGYTQNQACNILNQRMEENAIRNNKKKEKKAKKKK